MKNFLKFTLATIVGIIVSGILLFFISIMVFFSMVSASESETQISDNSIMMLKLNGTLTERSQPNPIDFIMKRDYNSLGLNDILSSIQKAREADKIEGIYIEAGDSFASSISSLQEIRNALLDFKKTGKFIIAYGDNYTQGMYYLSSVADKVLLPPQGMIEWKGLASTPVFIKDLLKNIGVEMQIFKVGAYKSATETWTNTAMSDASREQINAYLSDLWKEMASGVARSRGLSEETLDTLANRMLMFYPAEESVTCGLADTLIYKNDVHNYLKTAAGIEENDAMPILGLKEMINVKKNMPKDKSGNIVAVYYAYGTIDGSDTAPTEEEGINSNKVIKDLRKLQEDEDVKAVVLRVNSPGGSAFGSEQIWHAVSGLKKEKPVIVSMGDYAASGGYYISCNADTIVADPTTLTGSIGIFGMIPNFEGLADKFGVGFDVVKTHSYSDFGMLARPMNESEKSLMQMSINQGYDLFLTRCAEGRGLSKDKIDEIAQGRVWSGVMAKKLGLVDELGGLDRALEIAIAKAGIDAHTVISYPKKENFFTNLLKADASNYILTKIFAGQIGTLYRPYRILKELSESDRIQARMPFELNIY